MVRHTNSDAKVSTPDYRAAADLAEVTEGDAVTFTTRTNRTNGVRIGNAKTLTVDDVTVEDRETTEMVEVEPAWFPADSRFGGDPDVVESASVPRTVTERHVEVVAIDPNGDRPAYRYTLTQSGDDVVRVSSCKVDDFERQANGVFNAVADSNVSHGYITSWEHTTVVTDGGATDEDVRAAVEAAEDDGLRADGGDDIIVAGDEGVVLTDDDEDDDREAHPDDEGVELLTDGGVEPAYEPGEVFPIDFRVRMFSNPAHIPYYHIRVDVFLHRFEDTGEWVLMVSQDWLDDHPNDVGTGAKCADYARYNVDGTPVDPADPFENVRIDRPTATDGGRPTCEGCDRDRLAELPDADGRGEYVCESCGAFVDEDGRLPRADDKRCPKCHGPVAYGVLKDARKGLRGYLCVDGCDDRRIVRPEEDAPVATDGGHDVTVAVYAEDDEHVVGLEAFESGFVGLLIASSRNTIDSPDVDDDRVDAVYDAFMSPVTAPEDDGLRCDGGKPPGEDVSIAPNYDAGGVWFTLGNMPRRLLSPTDARAVADHVEDRFGPTPDGYDDVGDMAERLRSLADEVEEKVDDPHVAAFDDIPLTDPEA